MIKSARGISDKNTSYYGNVSVDISIILNAHNEYRYLHRTILSLGEAAQYARIHGLSTEIVVVLDRADVETASLIDAYNYKAFDGVQIIKVSNGSLGLSRNDGIKVARGTYIATADADDLVSFNYLHKMYMTAHSSSSNTIVFPEYYFGFGTDCYIWKFYNSEHISPAVFFDKHPYVSRVMFRREHSDRVRFADVSLSSGYAYEDWHFNCECLAAGLEIQVAKSTIVFYRQRAGSLLRQADTLSSRLIPASKYFEPETFVKLTWMEMNKEKIYKAPEPVFSLNSFVNDAFMNELVAGANQIDPAVSMGILKYRHAGSNFMQPSNACRAYFELCERIIEGGAFTDVVLLPSMSKGGAEKFIISVLDSLSEIDPGTRILVLGGEQVTKHEWLERLPANSLFIDLHRLGVVGLSQADVELISFRIVGNLQGLKRIHVKNSIYADNFVRKYGHKIKTIPTYNYYFCEEHTYHGGIGYTNGYGFDLISEHYSDFSGIISDHGGILETANALLGGGAAGKMHALYAECAVPARRKELQIKPQNRLLWASRIDEQKRPELLRKIANKLQLSMPWLVIEAYGSAASGGVDATVFQGSANLKYIGGFEGFDSFDTNRYDALIYTTAFDGLPNVILEAMAAELPVISTLVGGIGEILSAQTGYVVDGDADDDVVANNYVQALAALYQDDALIAHKVSKANALIRERHSKGAFNRRVAEIFELQRLESECDA